jgi:lipoyl(octanoyl) transferase
MPARNATAQELWVCDLGSVPYADALRAQERIRELRQRERLPDTLLLLEHPPVYTLGRRAEASDLPLGEDFYRERGIEIHACDRGGRITYHGPGQLVGYPILAVSDVLEYVRTLERAIVAALARERLNARSRSPEGADFTGVWVQERKIASIGVHLQRGVTTHGFAVNVCNALEPFGWIVACGLPGVSMTSLQRELAGAAGAHETSPAADDALMGRFRAHMLECLCESLHVRALSVSPAELGLAGANPSRPAATRAPLPSPALDVSVAA